MIDKYYNKERKYNKVSAEAIKASRKSCKGVTSFSKEYRGLTHAQRTKKAAANASDNGRCWWIYEYIIRTTMRPKTIQYGLTRHNIKQSTKDS